MLKNVANKILKSSTPKYAYHTPNEQTLNDGVYIFRMAPFTDVNDQGGVWFPNVSIIDCFDNSRTSIKLAPAIKLIEEYIKELNVVTHSDPETFSFFSLLHEEGHWEHYIDNYVNKGISGEEYMKDNEKISLEMGITSLLFRARENNELYYDYHKIYREHPFEKYADEYAIRNMKSMNL